MYEETDQCNRGTSQHENTCSLVMKFITIIHVYKKLIMVEASLLIIASTCMKEHNMNFRETICMTNISTS